MKKALALITVTAACALANSAHAAGVTLTFACDSVGSGYNECQKGANAWAKKTGNTVKLVQVPKETDQRLALYQQQLGARASDVDVYMIDVVWPGLISQHLLDLSKYIPQSEVAQHFPAIVKNNTVNGKLVGMPFFTDAGVLYYRTDLLAKYGYKSAPKTWDELAEMAKKIQDGERKANSKFVGFVFQGKNYEGLTCDALEWISSFGGGSIVDASGKVTINNPQAVAALKAAQGFVGSIAPSAVTTYGEEEARNVWQAGNAAFMRNWPYAYAAGQAEGSAVKGKIGVAALPAGKGGKPAATLGGWQLAVNAYSKHPKEAADLVRYMTGAQEQKRRAIEASYNPTIASLYKDQGVLKAVPFFGSLYNVFTNAVARPATITGSKYNQVSDAFSTAVYSVLTKKAQPEAALSSLQSQINRIKGRGW
ncbi:ABC transporter substrate-binding protein [Deinococcus maricopensis]|uniref:Extracellular solute-binding protein family 1 n=1 Tax=Deinococcus maricopensis (strain DSM 21211 / LMG 22137 / NRRL B-23946 / LB-34) TaxID=709986 RepID=E8U8I5_DEIML|nr:ABC transporter substrate-binding protein [Deinococcus maricopensis]ADV67374.1 extracellular solute-binding protein family 1 [Deinococcus maricopensis DSM 21211]